MIVMEMITEEYCFLWELPAPYPHHDASLRDSNLFTWEVMFVETFVT